jgi:hypothetical protein
MEATQYKMVSSTELESFNQQVNDLLKEGYELWGSSYANERGYSQAMAIKVKEKTEAPPKKVIPKVRSKRTIKDRDGWSL